MVSGNVEKRRRACGIDKPDVLDVVPMGGFAGIPDAQSMIYEP